MSVKETIAAYVRRSLISSFRISREDIQSIDIIDYDVWDQCHNVKARIQLVDEFDIWERLYNLRLEQKRRSRPLYEFELPKRPPTKLEKMAKEIVDLKEENEKLKKRISELEALIK